MLSPFGSLAGVVDALYMGIYYPDVVRQHRHILAPGSIGPALYPAPTSEMYQYCPELFVFSDVADAMISLGIERLECRDPAEGLLLPAKAKILVARGIVA